MWTTKFFIFLEIECYNDDGLRLPSTEDGWFFSQIHSSNCKMLSIGHVTCSASNGDEVIWCEPHFLALFTFWTRTPIYNIAEWLQPWSKKKMESTSLSYVQPQTLDWSAFCRKHFSSISLRSCPKIATCEICHKSMHHELTELFSRRKLCMCGLRMRGLNVKMKEGETQSPWATSVIWIE